MIQRSLAMAGCTVALACAGSEPPAKAPNDAPRVRDRVVPSLDVAGATATADAPQAAAARLEPPGPDARSGGRGLANPRHGNARDRHGRVASLRYITWIYARADVRSKKLGYIRAGTSIALRQSARVDGWGNCRGFYAVEPRGFVCNDDSATADLGHPIVRAGRHTRTAEQDRPYRWALSLGAPMYNRLPTAKEHGRVIKRYPVPTTLDGWVKKYVGLASDSPITPSGPVPDYLRGGKSVPTPFTDRPALVRKTIPLGSIVAYTRAFRAHGETWLLSSDLTVVPASRVRRYTVSDFGGVRIDETTSLPLAWVTAGSAPQHRREGGSFRATGAAWPKLRRIALTGQRRRARGITFYETDEEEDGERLWIDDSDAAVLEQPKRPRPVEADERWILIRISEGTLSAHEGDRTVFATLMSPGSGGVQPPGGDPIKLSTTPLGTYRVTWKDRSAGMSPDPGDPKTFWIQDVPWTMYFQAPFAIHAAFWHDSFGRPKSGGCVNLSPRDARTLFEWAGPELPEGWQGVAHGGPNGKGTRVVVVP